MNPAEQYFSRLDLALADFFQQRTQLNDTSKIRFGQIIANLSNQLNQGHTCVLLDKQEADLICSSGLALQANTVDEDSRSPKPLVLENQRLYFHRYWLYEQRLSGKISEIVRTNQPFSCSETLLVHYFPKQNGVNWQKEACKAALQNNLCLISGGPGTGKTTTVIKILAVLLELSEKPLYIALAAPTGKAAMRLQEAIGIGREQLSVDTVKSAIPDTVTTIHRLLGAKPPSPYFYHDRHKPLPHDVIVIDEASMVDLALMSKLLDAIKPGARLILMGDKDQLASVESGAVLADFIEGLPENTAELKVAYRFNTEIKNLADAINQQDPEKSWQLLQKNPNTSILQNDPIAYIEQKRGVYWQMVQTGAGFEDLLQEFQKFQVLCATRYGPNSVTYINHQIEQRWFARNAYKHSMIWYPGRPVMITQNSPKLGLYNGDIGLCLFDLSQSNFKKEFGKDANKNQLLVYFKTANGDIRKYLPARLPECQTAYAMTIHKSQGSEFDEVLILLPQQTNPILSKELLYTAVTRAKQRLQIAASQPILTGTVLRKIQRVSGLAEKIRTINE